LPFAGGQTLLQADLGEPEPTRDGRLTAALIVIVVILVGSENGKAITNAGQGHQAKRTQANARADDDLSACHGDLPRPSARDLAGCCESAPLTNF
jgi:hypothetical protein